MEHGQLLGLGSATLVLFTFTWQLRALWRSRELVGFSPAMIAGLSGAALALGGYAVYAGEVAFALVNALVLAVGAILLLRWRELARV